MLTTFLYYKFVYICYVNVNNMKKRLIQRLNQLLDRLVDKDKKLEVSEDIRKLKLSESDYFVITMTNKYKHYEKKK